MNQGNDRGRVRGRGRGRGGGGGNRGRGRGGFGFNANQAQAIASPSPIVTPLGESSTNTNHSPPPFPFPSRGRGGRGRGRGGLPKKDHSTVSFDYHALTSEALGFTPLPKTPFIPTPLYTPNPKREGNFSANAYGRGGGGSWSGYGTPTRGGSGYGTPTGGGSGYGTPTRGRGGFMRGGFGDQGGYSSPRGGGGGMDLSSRPLLVPVTFVKATIGGLDATVGVLPKPVESVRFSVEEEDDELVIRSTVVGVEGLSMASISDQDSELEEIVFAPTTAHNLQAKTLSPLITRLSATIPSNLPSPLSNLPSPQLFPSTTMDTDDDSPIEFTLPVTLASLLPELELLKDASIGIGRTREEEVAPPLVCLEENEIEGELIVPTINLELNPTVLESNPQLLYTTTTLLDSITTTPLEPTPPLLEPKPPKPPQPKSKPAPKLTKAQKREGKKARKKGVTHSRSGNKHLAFDNPPDDDDSYLIEEDEVVAREGDSDLDWGESGPPLPLPLGASKKSESNRQKRTRERIERLDEEKLERISRSTRMVVDGEVSRSERRRTRDQEAVEDYINNLKSQLSSNEDEDVLATFTGPKVQQVSIADIAVEARYISAGEDEDEDDGWGTASDSVADLTLGEADAQVELLMELEESRMDVDDLSSSSGSESDDEEDDDIEEELEIIAALQSGRTVKVSGGWGSASPAGGGKGSIKERKSEKKRRKKGKGKAQSESSEDDDDDDEDDDEDDDDDEDEGRYSRAKLDQVYASEIQDLLDAEILNFRGGKGKVSGSRKDRNALFRQMESGDFRNVDFDDGDDFDFEDDFILRGPAKKKNSKPDKKGDFADQLQAQWEKDRAKKAVFKQQRALERDSVAWTTSADESNMDVLHTKIRDFVLHDISKTSLALPPMSKKSRVAIHLLAEVYGLKSKSAGKGAARFPILERTARTATAGVNQKRVRAILETAKGGGYDGPGKWGLTGKIRVKGNGKSGGWRAFDEDADGDRRKSSAGGNSAPFMGGKGKNKEGYVVGAGADKIGEGSLGFALLQRMGWKDGEQIGMSGGIHEPITARIKTNKSGLGSGYSLSRTEAVSFSRSN